ncbi:hypothetical protein H4R33_003977 [Dimargaris cristalligena]|nr:hypothetical protein H4R33_003977 [Dimargaris cristalligena]
MASTPLTKRRLDEVAATLTPTAKRKLTSSPATGADAVSPANTERLFRATRPDLAVFKAFKPWDRESLLDRLSTYQIHTWRINPPALSPVVCSRYGWINTDKNTLRCGYCLATLLMDLSVNLEPDSALEPPENTVDLPGSEPLGEANSKMEVKIEPESPSPTADPKGSSLVAKYLEQLTTAHNTQCPWRQRHCEATLYTIPLQTADELRSELVESCTISSPSLTSSLPAIEHPLSDETCKRLLAILSPPHLTASCVQTPHSTSAPSAPTNPSSPVMPSPETENDLQNQSKLTRAILHLFGWNMTRTLDRDISYCPMCFRKVALWMFQSLASPSNPDPAGGTPTKKPNAPAPTSTATTSTSCLVDSTQPLFDVSLEHRAFCYWVNPDPRLREPENADDSSVEARVPWRRNLDNILSHFSDPSESTSTSTTHSTHQDPDDVLLYIRQLLG